MADMLCCDITNICYLFTVFIFYYKTYENFKKKLLKFQKIKVIIYVQKQVNWEDIANV